MYTATVVFTSLNVKIISSALTAKFQLTRNSKIFHNLGQDFYQIAYVWAIGHGRVKGNVHFTNVQKRLIMNLMEMCSKGTPSIETEELKRKYPAERVIENVPTDANEYPAECGPSLFW